MKKMDSMCSIIKNGTKLNSTQAAKLRTILTYGAWQNVSAEQKSVLEKAIMDEASAGLISAKRRTA